MANQILITIGHGLPVRCIKLDDTKSKAIAAAGQDISAEITPIGLGGRLTTLNFDNESHDWVPA